MECDCHLRYVQDLPADGPTPYESGFNAPLDGPIISFGAEFQILPNISERPSGTGDLLLFADTEDLKQCHHCH